MKSPWFCILLLAALCQITHARSLWSTSPANARDIIRTAYPLGNGRLGAMPFGPAGLETLNLNLDTLWSGGPFEVDNYTGGNPTSPVAPALSGIRDWIFSKGTGNVTKLLGSVGGYGSYRVLGNLSVTIPSLLTSSASVTNYTRTIDAASGMHTTRFRTTTNDFETSVFCSFPDQVCVYAIEASSPLPALELRLDNQLVDSKLQNVTCFDEDVGGLGYVRLRGVTQLGPPEGMQYDAVARVVSDTSFVIACNSANNVLNISPGNGTRTVAIVVGAGTNYDAKKGTAKYGYSFRGGDPGPTVERTTLKAATKTFAELRNGHIADFTSLTSRFELTLPDPLGSAQTPTSELIARYNANNSGGDPYLESLLLDYATYLFISSSRPGSLPPNLQGRWSESSTAAWSGDYHANINLQMNHWTADQTGLTDLQSPLWNYMVDTWLPRGLETAKLLYGAPGWVVHDEMNIFGHTGMKSDATWSNYAAAAAWMMQHVFDHWDYSQDTKWLSSHYPMVKGVAEFWLNQLQEDRFTGDKSLVANPCNSPEHGLTTFGCSHFQQLVHQVFEAVLSVASAIDETSSTFLANVSSSLERLDKGFHIGHWGQIKEWKLPDSYGYDFVNDTHRHLSDLVGWYPGYSLSGILGGYRNATVQDAVAQKLYSRGTGNAKDANAGWAKVWRSACWARLNNTERAHFELRYAIDQNFAANGLSMYSGTGIPFQIDANFGLGGAVLSMLIVDLPAAFGDNSTRTVVLGPAIPKAWAGGTVRGLRLRGGGSVDFEWDEQGIVTSARIKERQTPLHLVNKKGVFL